MAREWDQGGRASGLAWLAESRQHALPILGPWATRLAVIVLAAAILTFLPGLKRIAPLVESDYCYLLIAADRLYEGLGLTSLQPVAPHQPWDWRYDWGFLTQWPAGYPMMIAAIRWVSGGTSLEACRIVSITGVAAALVGWFVFVRRFVGPGIPATLLALVAATTCLTPGMLVNPSTDLILIAVLPFVLLLLCNAMDSERNSGAQPAKDRKGYRTSLVYALAGGCAGLLCWFRYAAIFVPAALMLSLAIEWWRGRVGRAGIVSFFAAATVPILALVLLNALLGPAQSSTEQFNLGTNLGWQFSLSAVARAWWMLTDLGFYAYKPWVHWFLALGPLFLPAGLCLPIVRKTLLASFLRFEWRLAAAVLLTLLAMLICAAGLFGAKFDYISLERYYLPVRPLFVALLCGPLLHLPRRAVRLGICPVLLAFAFWTIFHEWTPAFSRWSRTREARTPAGAWSRIFEPNAREVYDWVRSQPTGNVLIFSNFHEYLAFETNVITLPIPPSRQALDLWIEHARALRGTASLRVLFLINPDNLWRSYWIPAPSVIREMFDLVLFDDVPPDVQPFAFTPRARNEHHLTWISWN